MSIEPIQFWWLIGGLSLAACDSPPECADGLTAHGADWVESDPCVLHSCVEACGEPADRAECCLIVEGLVPADSVTPRDDGTRDSAAEIVSPAAALCLGQVGGVDPGIDACTVELWTGFDPDRYAVESLVEDACTSGIPNHTEGILVYVAAADGEIGDKAVTYGSSGECPSED